MKRSSSRSIEHFAKIPVSVLECEACKTLDHAAFKVLVIIASNYSGFNNGTFAMTPRFAKRFGTIGKNTIYRSLHELMERGLLVQTRQGMKMKNVFALYALGWEDIHSRDGKLLATPQLRNNKRWLDWRPVPAMVTDTENLHPHHGEQPVTTMGTGEAECVPTMGNRKPECVPTMGNTLRISPGVRSGAPPPVAGADSASGLSSRSKSTSRARAPSRLGTRSSS